MSSGARCLIPSRGKPIRRSCERDPPIRIRGKVVAPCLEQIAPGVLEPYGNEVAEQVQS